MCRFEDLQSEYTIQCPFDSISQDRLEDSVPPIDSCIWPKYLLYISASFPSTSKLWGLVGV